MVSNLLTAIVSTMGTGFSNCKYLGFKTRVQGVNEFEDLNGVRAHNIFSSLCCMPSLRNICRATSRGKTQLRHKPLYKAEWRTG